MKDSISQSGAWVSREKVCAAVANELAKVKLNADAKTARTIEAAFEEWRNSGFLYWLTKRPRPLPRIPANRDPETRPSQIWFETLPFFSWGGGDQCDLTASMGSRGRRLEELLSGLAHVPPGVKLVFLTLDDLATIGVPIDPPTE